MAACGKGHPLLKPLLHGFRTLLEQLDHERLSFVVRLKADTPVGVPWVLPHLTTTAGEVSLPDTPVTYHGHDWRLVRSDLKPGMKEAEPWFLLTNIPQSKLTRQQILRTYAKRFEIEEHFEDIKWMERYEWHHIRKLTVARTVFMFVFFGWWLLLRVYQLVGGAVQHPKKQLSWFRTVWEY